MANPVLTIPGVYRQDRTKPAPPVLSTGVPAFIGLVTGTAQPPIGAAQNATSYGPVVLRRKSDYLGGGVKYLDHAISGFFDNGGDHCYVVGVRLGLADATASTELIKALQLIAPIDDIDLVAIPDATVLTGAGGIVDETKALDVQKALVNHCMVQANRVALLDALPNKDSKSLISGQVTAIRAAFKGPINAALYHPWIKTIASGDQVVPPSGHVAGIIAHSDALAGVFRAPANAEIQGATDLSADLDNVSLSDLNNAGVNCLRAFPGRGIRVWGARTLSTDADWRYLNVRRLVLTLLRWINLNMTWAAFEPNVPTTWARIERELNAYLTRLWRAGALQGASEDEAFFVHCDGELNPPATRDIGRIITEIGLAPAVPAEYIVLSVQHRAGTTELI